MPFGVTPTGYNRKRLEQIRQDILAKWKLRVSPSIDTSETGLEAQLAGAIAEEIDLVWQADEATYASKDPAQAQGQALDDLLSLRGLYRLQPRTSLVSANVNVNAGTYPAGSLVAFVAGDPSARFANDDVLVASTAGTYTNVLFRAERTGPIRANANTLTQVVPSTGFNSITNPTDAILGDNGESDDDFYARSESEFSSSGDSSTAAAIARAVRSVTGVTFVRVYENEFDTPDVNGVPGHAFETLVEGGAAADIAAAILRSKAAGVRPYGLTSVVASDSQGNTYSVGYSMPSLVQPWLSIQVIANPTLYPGDTAVRQLLIDWGDSHLTVGMDVVLAQLSRLIMEQPGVFDVLIAQAGSGSSPGAYVSSNFVVGPRERADLDSSRVAVSHVNATGPA